MIYLIGHLKPDLDSAAATISLKYLFDHVSSYERKNTVPVLADEANFETKTIFQKFGVSLPKVLTTDQIKETDQFVLVDHNEASQRLAGIQDNQITDIFDHHKVNLNLTNPIFITIKPWGSTNTLLYWLMEINELDPDKNLASLMLSAILSDTVGLKGPTTTQEDRETIKKLNLIAQIKNIDALTLEIFKAKSNLSGLNPKQILTKDYKLYEHQGQKIILSQIETVEQEELISQAGDLIKTLQSLKKEMGLSRGALTISDVLKFNSKAIVAPEDEAILLKAFPQAKKIKAGVYDIGAVMSRKKEIWPAVERAL